MTEVGFSLGPYLLTERVGVGGMGEVFRARDTRLDRDVAVKLLPSEFAVSPESRARFEREARLLSQLSHPNICVVHDVGEAQPLSPLGEASGDMVKYIVMEYIEGESLARRLTRGPLPIEQVLRYGAQIADALEKAHRGGVVHRDLKPGNVILTRSGAKLLDFGLAKAMEIVSEDSAKMRACSTESVDITREGRIVGTLRYMAPEQLGGVEADSRTDLFALGVLLYEMATGKPAFDSFSRISLIAAIASGDPRPMHDLAPMTPPALEHIVSRCMEKDPEDRWQSAHDIRVELEWISQVGSRAGIPFRLTWKRGVNRTLAVAVVTALIATLGTLGLTTRWSPAEAVVLNAELAPRLGERYVASGNAGGPAVISPDGRWIVYSARKADENAVLWVRSVETGETHPLPNTGGAYFPFWAPDSRNIGYFGRDGLRRIDVAGANDVLLSAARNGRGGSWGTDGTILFAPDVQTPLHRVTERGGVSTPLAPLSKPYSTYRWPAFLPDGDHYLFFAADHRDPTGKQSGVFVAALSDPTARLVIPSAANGVYAEQRLLFVRDKTLWAQPMLPDGTLEGSASVVARDVMVDPDVWRAGISVSDDSRLLYLQGNSRFEASLGWFDRQGKELGALGNGDQYWEIALSPDGSRGALSIGDPLRQLWIVDIARGARTRLTLDYAWTGGPIWSRDGDKLYFTAHEGTTSIVLRRSLSTGEQKELARIEGLVWPALEMTDGAGLILINDTAGDLVRLRPGGIGAVEPFIADPRTRESQLVGSPDGNWVAYDSDETGTNEVYIARANEPAVKYQISRGGGMQPTWRPDGQEFYYVDSKGMLMAVPVGESGAELARGEPVPLFRVVSTLGMSATRVYAPAPDGSRFLVIHPIESEQPAVRLVTGWTKTLKAE